jgi:hypothetical protein
MAHRMAGSPESGRLVSATAAVIVELPDSIREHTVLVGISEWLAARYPWQIATATRVRRRLLEEAA